MGLYTERLDSGEPVIVIRTDDIELRDYGMAYIHGEAAKSFAAYEDVDVKPEEIVKNRALKIEFVRYNGRYPRLCEGELTLRINGTYEFFGDRLDYRMKHCHRRFWLSGGDRKLAEGHPAGKPWSVEWDKLPYYLQPYYKDIERLFNGNVPLGCCGGCSVERD